MMLAAHQAHYLPYLGYLAKAALADVFVVQDDLQYVKQEWQNRNRIRAPEGWRWLTIPVQFKSSSRIADVMPASPTWWRKHRDILQNCYPTEYRRRIDTLVPAMRDVSGCPLAEINYSVTLELLKAFGCSPTHFVRESDTVVAAENYATPDDRLIRLCREFGCDTYLSGRGALAYLRPARWAEAGITLQILSIDQPPYPQPHGGWIPALSAVDTLLCVESPPEYLRGVVQRSLREGCVAHRCHAT